mgnify:CR=1 FL=1
MKQTLFFIVIWACALTPTYAQLGRPGPAGLENKDALSLQITPNPASKEVLISWTMDKTAPATLSIMDLEGCMTLSMNLGEIPESMYTRSVSVEAFTPGVYIVVLTVKAQIAVKKFIVEH